MLVLVVVSGVDRRKNEIRDAQHTTHRLAENFAERQEEETKRLRKVLEVLSRYPAVKKRDYPAVDEVFRHVLAANPGYVNFALLDSNGEAVASALAFTKQNLSHRKEVQEALSGETFCVGEYSIGQVSGERVLPFAYAVKDDLGTVEGVLIATQRQQDMAGLFDHSELPEGSFLGFADHKGIRLARYPHLDATPAGSPISKKVWEKISSAPDLAFFSDTGTDNVAREYAVRRVSIRQGADPYLYIFVAIPRTALLKNADVVTLRYFLWMTFSLLMASLLAYLVARHGIHAPLSRVLAVAQRVGRGDLAARTGLEKTGGSIGNLAAVVDDMAESLERDRAARDRAEQEIIRQKLLLDSLIEGATDAIFIKDAPGRYLVANSEVAKIVGKPLDAIVGHDDWSLFPKDEADKIRAQDQKVMASGETVSTQDTLSTAQGVLTYLTIKGPLRDEQGNVVGLFGIARDITEQLKVQELMLQTEKMMSVGGLAAGMAHEINNPLGGILQNVQVITRRLTEEMPANLKVAEDAGCSFESIKNFMERRGILDSMEAIREAGVRAAHIVSSMLDFCRKSGRNFAPTDVNALLDKTLELCATDYDLKRKYDFKSIAIHREYDLDLPHVSCLETQIQQVFMNILANSAHAMADTPSPALTLRTRCEGGHVRIEIEDNGPGMTEEVRKHVFEPFYTTKPVGEGTGLGLSVSYFIVVSHHQGTLTVESAPGRGTRFVIRLPVDQRAPDSGTP
ncbi:MAG: PAS domain-containing protein [Desulfovibrio sp.]|nr:PAS domain-containing protein [Desulfovibrio sp.]